MPTTVGRKKKIFFFKTHIERDVCRNGRQERRLRSGASRMVVNALAGWLAGWLCSTYLPTHSLSTGNTENRLGVAGCSGLVSPGRGVLRIRRNNARVKEGQGVESRKRRYREAFYSALDWAARVNGVDGWMDSDARKGLGLG